LYKSIILGLILIFLFSLVGCGFVNKHDLIDVPAKEDVSTHDEITPTPTPLDIEDTDEISEKIDKMTIDEKIGQMVIAGFDGTETSENVKNLVEKYKIGGLILFKKNIKTPGQLLSLINSIKMLNQNNKLPLFFSVDEEGGSLTRMPDDLKKLPTNEKVGLINNEDFSYNIGSIIAQEVKCFGFNLDFAPVLDINSNPKNPVIGIRSFGPDKNLVSKLGVATMKGIQSQNIIPVVKHFPGHGDTSVDSHFALPVVNHDLERLKNFELVPFENAIENDADAVMVAHILLKKIDPNFPSSLSKAVITDLLRYDLRFNGVVITDDMTMDAILKNYNLGDAAVTSVNAGADIILVCHGYERQIEVLNSLKKAVEDGKLTEDRIDESLYRILKLKQKYNLSDDAIDSFNIEDINNKISFLIKKYVK